MDDGYFFDNVVVSNSEAEAAEVREKAWAPKKVVEDAKEKEEQAKAEAEAKAAEEEAAKKKAEGEEDADDDEDDAPAEEEDAADEVGGWGDAGGCLFFSCQPQVHLVAGLQQACCRRWAERHAGVAMSSLSLPGLPLLQEAEAEAAAEKASEEENRAEL